jgi:hypothetical protein
MFNYETNPGHVNVYDVSNPRTPVFPKVIPAGPGAHHLAFSADERYLFGQNSLLNLPRISNGSVTVIDVAKSEPIANMETLRNQGLNPGCIVLLPQRPLQPDAWQVSRRCPRCATMPAPRPTPTAAQENR